MGCTYFKVEMREKNSDNWTALGVLQNGAFVQAYGVGAGLKFFDHESATGGMRAAMKYFDYADRIADFKVSEVHG